MAAGPVTVLDIALQKIGAEIDLAADSFNVVLTTSAQPLTAAFTGGSGEALYSDLTDEVIGDGYAAGGLPLENTAWTQAGSVVAFTADATAWDALTATAKYAVIVRSDGGSPEELTDIL